MKIIDERGRLFGKINIIDFLVLFFLFCLTPMFYFGYKLFNRPVAPVLLSQKVMPLDLYCRVNNLTPEELDRITVGDTFIDDAGNNIGEILSVGEPGIYSYNVDLGSGHIVSNQNPERRQVLIKARILGEARNEAFYYRGEKVMIGSKIQLKTKKYSIEGLVDSETKDFFLELIEININLKPLNPEEAGRISVGDTFIDDAGNNIGEILSVGEPQIYLYNMDFGDGNMVSRQDPERRQVLIKARILGEVRNDAFYYGGEKVMIGSKIQLKTKNYAVGGIIELTPKLLMSMLIEPVNVLLKVKFKDIMPEVADIVSVGDEEKDISGFVIKKVKSIVSSGPSESVIFLQDGKLAVASNPMSKDMVLIIEAVCTKNEDRLFLNKNIIKVGSVISLKTDKYDMEGRIIDIND